MVAVSDLFFYSPTGNPDNERLVIIERVENAHVLVRDIGHPSIETRKWVARAFFEGGCITRPTSRDEVSRLILQDWRQPGKLNPLVPVTIKASNLDNPDAPLPTWVAYLGNEVLVDLEIPVPGSPDPRHWNNWANLAMVKKIDKALAARGDIFTDGNGGWRDIFLLRLLERPSEQNCLAVVRRYRFDQTWNVGKIEYYEVKV